MPNIVTEMLLRELDRDIGEAQGMLIVSFGGLTVAETETVRNELAAKGVPLRMVRNKLTRRILAGRGIELSGDALKGNTAIAWGDAEAAIDAAKALSSKELKKTGKVKFQAALLEGEVLDATAAAAMADLPDRDTVNAMILGVISGPARGLVGVLAGLPGATARVIQARADSLPQD